MLDRFPRRPLDSAFLLHGLDRVIPAPRVTGSIFELRTRPVKLDLTSLIEELKRSFPRYSEQEIQQALEKVLREMASKQELKSTDEKYPEDPGAGDAG